MEPLKTWNCDVCGEPIENVDEGYVVWRSMTDQRKTGDFKIIHQRKCDPGSQAGFSHSLPLQSFLGANGLAMLLSWLSLGPILGRSGTVPEVEDFDEYVDFVRRVQTPYYEESRARFGDEDVTYWLGDSNEYVPFLPDTLKRIADRTLGS